MYDNFSYATAYPTRQTLKKEKSESAVRRDLQFFIHIQEDKKV